MKSIRYIGVVALLVCAAFAVKGAERLVGINGAVYSLVEEEADAVEFLYRSMPLSDRLMYSPDFYIRNVRTSLQARREMRWGDSVPAEVWQYFVLPLRSGNEYLDNFRVAYYPELKQRVEGMSMEQAALEINHWLHEKVTYEPSDSRTSAPMATLRTGLGRCGEESVLGVAAFRAVGIPARQVYTPRWAHTDDNHAWVEVWVDGAWHFLGACEPEPALDLAWFNAPVSRGVLMHTRVFGEYPGPEQIISRRGGITEINVTGGYVPVRESTVRVIDREGKPLAGIPVAFKIYNYAEFFTGATVTTDSRGWAMLKTGKGDMLAWAAHDGYFGFAKIEGEQTELRLTHKVGEDFSVTLDIVPPAENPLPSKVSEEAASENKKRFERENKMRQAYEQTFFGAPLCERSMEDIDGLFATDEQRREAYHYLVKARGNWHQIYDYLQAVPKGRIHDALKMLGVISEKDLRDTPARILISTITNTPADDGKYDDLYAPYVLNPRVSNELLSDYRRSLRIPGRERGSMSGAEIVEYTKKNIRVDDGGNAYRVPVTPYEVWRAHEGDSHSRDIFFVALCRNQGVPARIEPVTGAVQYYDNGEWQTVEFEAGKPEPSPLGTLKGSYGPCPTLRDPEYYRHFTFSSMKGGMPRLLEYGDDFGETFSSVLEQGASLPAGYYVLTSGVRQASGAVRATMRFFNIKEGKETTIPLAIEHAPGAIEVIGAIDAEQKYLPAGSGEESSILSTVGRGYFLLALLGESDEPSNHAERELEALVPVIGAWGRPVLVIGREGGRLRSLPGVHFGSDPEGKVGEMMLRACGADEGEGVQRPVVLVADSFGRVVFASRGYDTSLAVKLQSLLPLLE